VVNHFPQRAICSSNTYGLLLLLQFQLYYVSDLLGWPRTKRKGTQHTRGAKMGHIYFICVGSLFFSGGKKLSRDDDDENSAPHMDPAAAKEENNGMGCLGVSVLGIHVCCF